MSLLDKRWDQWFLKPGGGNDQMLEIYYASDDPMMEFETLLKEAFFKGAEAGMELANKFSKYHKGELDSEARYEHG